MLTQLNTVKSRLALTVTYYDDLLTSAIKAVSDRFDKECHRTLARTTSATHEFEVDETEVSPPCYPIESVTKFELKSNETDGWSEQTGLKYLANAWRAEREEGRVEGKTHWLRAHIAPRGRLPATNLVAIVAGKCYAGTMAERLD